MFNLYHLNVSLPEFFFFLTKRPNYHCHLSQFSNTLMSIMNIVCHISTNYLKWLNSPVFVLQNYSQCHRIMMWLKFIWSNKNTSQRIKIKYSPFLLSVLNLSYIFYYARGHNIEFLVQYKKASRKKKLNENQIYLCFFVLLSIEFQI